MTNEEIKHKIENALKAFASGNMNGNATKLFGTLGYTSGKRLQKASFTPDEFLASYNTNVERPLNHKNALVKDWKQVHFLFQLTAEEIQNNAQMGFVFDTKNRVDNTIIESYLFFVLELAPREYSRTELSVITREINKIFPQPVMILFSHGKTLTLSIIDRRLNKTDENKDVLQKVTLIKDISIVTPHRAHVEILFDLSLDELQKQFGFTNFVELHRAWQKALDSSELNKKFFKELSNWYFWALQNVTFPAGAGDDADVRNATSVIRLITRLIFIWFIKEKNLVPEDLFNQNKVKGILKNSNAEETTYYKAILQNLFFATLNQEMNTQEKPNNRQFRGKSKQPNGRDQHYGITNLYRYEDYFQQPAVVLKLFSKVPFLNGGLFECLDKPDKEDPNKIIRIDGFSDHKDNAIRVPNFLFFSNEQDIDLNKVYDTKNKTYKVRGLIDLLERYKFTINENTPIEEEVALDPELLGKVFENLLASYNPETQTTARKSTGSYYTPREIVNYMVDESLIAYLTTCLKEKLPELAKTDGLDDILREVFAYKEYKGNEHYFSAKESAALIDAIDNAKVLDPACGSGAFPMGILHKLVFILNKLDPHNEMWKERQIVTAKKIDDIEAREAAVKSIEDSFTRNELDYARKLYLIQNCIYGVDIQPIAVQIAKLRFFISLVVDQKLDETQDNRGILPLPNLETKFVAANTLIPLDKPKLGQRLALRSPSVIQKEQDLASIRKDYFAAKTPARKLKCRETDARLRAELANLLKDDGFPGKTAKLLANWDPYDQNTHAEWFDPEWMFGVIAGFDVIIANPPYVSAVEHVKNDPASHDLYRRLYPLLDGAYDLYVVFLLRGEELCKPTASYAWIVPNKLLIADYSKASLKHLINSGLHSSIDVSIYHVFENTGVYPIIILGNKFKDKHFSSFSISQIGDLSESKLIIKDNETLREFTTFKDMGVKIGSGATGFQAQLIVDCLYENRVSSSIPFIVSGSIDRYLIDYENVRYMGEKYQKAFVVKGEGIADSKWSFWNKEKIVIAGMTKRIEAYYSTKPLGLGVGVYAIFDYADFSPKYLLGILNSKYLSYYLNVKFKDKHLAGGYLAINKTTIEQLPLVKAQPSKEQTIIDIVDRILLHKLNHMAGSTTDLEDEIDQLVYQIYELTPEEIAVVEGKK